jgi:hypothetical protein
MLRAAEWDQLHRVIYDNEQQVLDARCQVPGVRYQGEKSKSMVQSRKLHVFKDAWYGYSGS